MREPGEGNYRRIEVEMGRAPTEGETAVIERIGERYPEEELVLSIEDTVLVLFLHRVDVEAFGETIRGLLADPGPDDGTGPFYDLIDAVDAIGSYGIQGGRRVYAGYNDERKVRDRKQKMHRRGSYFYALDSPFQKTEHAVPEEYLDRIICGDSQEVLKQLPDNCIDVVVTSPPYNFGLGYENSEDGIDWTAYFEKLFAVFDECIRVVKYGGRIIVNVQPLFSDYIPIHHIISTFFMDRRMIWKGEILWEKNNYNCKYTAWGSWKSPSSPYLKYTWEFVEIFAKGDLKKKGAKEDIDITDEEFKKWVVAKWSIAPERNMKRYDHPAMFPEELVERALKLFSYRNDIVLDPFNGVGTTTAVAKRLGRRYLGIDVSEEYCVRAERRLGQHLP